MDLGELPGYRAVIAGQYDTRYGEMGTENAQRLQAAMTPYVHRILRLLDLPDQGTLLDVGCGSGLVALAAAHAKPHLRVTGLDASPGALATGRRLAEDAGLDRVAFVEGDAETPPAGPWDRVSVASVFNLLPEKPAALRAWRCALADDGRLVVADAFATGGASASGVGAMSERGFRELAQTAGLRVADWRDVTIEVHALHGKDAWLWPEYVRPGFRYLVVALDPVPGDD